MKKIILISGSSYGVGKDTFATMLKSECEAKHLRAQVMHFGDWVKDSLARYYNWDGKKDEKGRALLQRFATDQVRKHDWDYWAEVTYRLASAIQEDWDVLLIPDMRFPNEYECGTRFFNPHDMLTVKIERESTTDSINRNHISEHAVESFPYDIIIDNNGTLDELNEKAIKLLDKITKV